MFWYLELREIGWYNNIFLIPFLMRNHFLSHAGHHEAYFFGQCFRINFVGNVDQLSNLTYPKCANLASNISKSGQKLVKHFHFFCTLLQIKIYFYQHKRQSLLPEIRSKERAKFVEPLKRAIKCKILALYFRILNHLVFF